MRTPILKNGAGTPANGAVWFPWVVAAIGLVVTFLAFYPGYMSQDSAAQYLQARTGKLNTQHPAMMALIWQLTDRIVPGPGGIFGLFVILYWIGLALLAAHAMKRRWAKVLAILGIGWWPPMIGLLAHVWKDVGLLAGFLLACGLLAWESAYPSRVLLTMALIVIGLSAGFRHNGIFAALPFTAYLAVRWLRSTPDDTGTTRSRLIAVAALAAFVTITIAKLPDYLPSVQRRSMWPTVALWDLAAVSLEERQILIPDSLLRPGVTLQEIDSNFSAFTNTSTFSTDKIRLSLWEPYDAKQNRDLLRAWLALPFEHGSAYWHHRWRLTCLLFGSGAQGRPSYLVLQPEYQQVADNPPVVPNRSALNTWVIGALQYLVRTPLFGGWLYMALAALVLVGCIVRAGGPNVGLAATVAVSGVCYAVPLSVLSGAADFRYLSWLVGASLVAAMLLLGGGVFSQSPSVPTVRKAPARGRNHRRRK